MFRNQGTDYYGDNDEMDPSLAEEEDAESRKGMSAPCREHYALARKLSLTLLLDWQTMVSETAQTLGINSSSDLPEYPTASTSKLPPPTSDHTISQGSSTETSSKRKANDESEAMTENGDEEESTKKAKTTAEVNGGTVAVSDPMIQQQAAMVSAFLGVLDPESLKNPVLPGMEEMGRVLLEVRKKALREEYGV